MAGLLQAYAERQGADLVINPVGCPLADAVPREERAGIRCWREHQASTLEWSCPYALRLHDDDEPTHSISVASLATRMSWRGLSQLRVRVMCLVARSATRPGC